MRIPRKLLFAAPLLLLLYFYGLTSTGLGIDPDEPRYASVAREMATSGDWVTPRLWGKPWFEKPALLYWMTAVGFTVGLGPELAPRLPVAILSVWFLIFYFLRMRREFGERTAWMAAVMLATSGGWMVYSHFAVTEIPLATTFAASMMLALPWVRSGGRRGLMLGGVLLGLAVLAKGLVPLVLAIPLFWIGRRRWKELSLYLLAALLVAFPWYLMCYLRNGWPFIEVFFIQHHFGRFLSPELKHVQPWWFYIPVLLVLLFPWIPALAAVRTDGWREPRRLLLLGWLVFGFVFFSASTNKLPGYLLPLLPAATALMALGLGQNWLPSVFAASAALLTVLPLVGAVLPEAVANGLRSARLDEIWWPGVALGIIGTLAVIIAGRRNSSWAFDIAALAAGIGFVSLNAVTLPRLDRTASARPRWREMVEQRREACLNDERRGVRYGLNYYAGRELPDCDSGREINHDILDRDKGISR